MPLIRSSSCESQRSLAVDGYGTWAAEGPTPPARASHSPEEHMSLNVTLLRESFDLVVGRAPDLTHRFYEILFERYPVTRSMFPESRRGQQENMLTQALVAVLDHIEDAP